MTDLIDLFRLAFLGEGLVCLGIAALASLLVTPKLRPGRVATATFLACWAYPFAALASAYDRAVAWEAVGHAVAALPSDGLWLILRFVGIYLVISVLWRARLTLHGRRPTSGVEARAA